MQSINPIDAREAEIARIAKSERDMAALQQHLKEIIEGTAFKGSFRSGQFLRYIVDQAIAGHFEALKERVIGVELFGRSPSYETGEDAIVRVTASDVRKRLLQHYDKVETTSPFRIRLPLGSYIPEITCESHREARELNLTDARREPVSALSDPAALGNSGADQQEPAVGTAPISRMETGHYVRGSTRQWLSAGILFTALNLGLWGLFWVHSARSEPARVPLLPWSAFFSSPHSTQLITSDPNIAEIQGFTGGQISVSDYANHKYIPEPNTLTPEADRFCRTVLRGDKSAAVDTPIAVNIAELAQARSKQIYVHAARNIQLSDLKTDDNFILLGSPRSNPWSALFSGQLDFQFAFDDASRREIIRNIHPHQNELPVYVPTARGWTTGQSYAIIAFIQNPDQNGQVLLLAGADAEGTEAAGKLVTDLPRLSATLQKCGIDPSGPLQHFELLLHLNTMAGSPNNIEGVACHILPGAFAQRR